MADKDAQDEIWEHGERRGTGFWCRHCRLEKKGGGATRFKEHLAHRGSNVAKCKSVPPKTKEYWQRALDRVREHSMQRARSKHLQEQVAGWTSGGGDGGGEWQDEYIASGMTEEEIMKATMERSSQEAEFMDRAGPNYERGGGSGSGRPSSQGQGFMAKMFGKGKIPTVQERTRARDYNISTGGATVQPRIDNVL